ncbi:Cell cycle control protein 50A [Nymphon striatum]|nr:Cell cycle control protein 50A [Nymphon striatum]
MATPASSPDEQIKSKKPSDSAFKQQKLPAWQPILTAGTVLPAFFVIGIAFIPIGIGLLVSSNEVKEYVHDYTYCNKSGTNITCSDIIANNISSACECKVTIELTESFESNVYLYYGLTNFYQNHRRYVKSRDDRQLLGKEGALSSSCEPFDYVKKENGDKIPIAPCGAIANSLFNDTFKLFYKDTGSVVQLIPTGIAWPTDKNSKFNNPPGKLNAEGAFKDTAKPPYWSKPVWQLDSDNPGNNGYKNEDLIVWMRTAALPTFRKLHRRVDHGVEGFRRSLPKGTYELTINYSYPVVSFQGTKRIILSTTSWLGGKNPFLGIAYIVVGCLCLAIGCIFLVIHQKYGKSIHEAVNINQRTGY